MIDHTRMLKRCIHDAWFKWYWQGACQVDKTSWRFGNWFDLNGRKSVMVFWKRRNFVMSAYLYRASMHKIINIIEKWGSVLFEMMKVHEKYRYMQISTENWNIFLLKSSNLIHLAKIYKINCNPSAFVESYITIKGNVIIIVMWKWLPFLIPGFGMSTSVFGTQHCLWGFPLHSPFWYFPSQGR